MLVPDPKTTLYFLTLSLFVLNILLLSRWYSLSLLLLSITQFPPLHLLLSRFCSLALTGFFIMDFFLSPLVLFPLSPHCSSSFESCPFSGFKPMQAQITSNHCLLCVKHKLLHHWSKTNNSNVNPSSPSHHLCPITCYCFIPFLGGAYSFIFYARL